MASPSVLDVFLHGQEIGTLTQLGGDRTLFAFNDAYINDSARSTLSLSFLDAYGELIVDVKPTQRRVPPFFVTAGVILTPLAEVKLTPLWLMWRPLDGRFAQLGDDSGDQRVSPAGSVHQGDCEGARGVEEHGTQVPA